MTTQQKFRSVKIAGALLVVAVAACSPAAHHLSPGELVALKPADPHVAQLYEHSCKACHAQEGTGAPLVHDHDAWDPRWAKGEDVLLNHAVVGFQAMPAGGQCAACTPKDYQAIIRFMADREQGQ
jgi:cytochrome c5